MSKYKTFKTGDKVHVKSLEQIKKEFKLYDKTTDGEEIYLGDFDIYFTPHMDKFCGKEVIITERRSDSMTEDEPTYDFFSDMYNIEGSPDLWSPQMFKWGIYI